MAIARYVALSAVVLVLPACGKRGDPLPPLPRYPQAVTGLVLSQRGAEVVLQAAAPRQTAAGAPLGVFEVEILRADAGGDIEKLAKPVRVRVAPGETFTHSWPLPIAGTNVRVAARGLNRGQRGPLAEAMLLVQEPPKPPTGLTPTLDSGGVVLAWTGGVARVYRRGQDGRYAAPLDAKAVPSPFRDATVTPGQSWCYVVRSVAGAQGLAESLPSTEACVGVRDVFAPATPVGVAALGAGGVVDVSWSPSSEGDLASYRVYRAEGGAPERLAELPAGETRYRDEKAAAGVAYTYTVTAVDKDGNESAPSPGARVRLQ
ncbi:MAG: hypothetical protein ABW221_22105 [Vicinamibacteria bacterium]